MAIEKIENQDIAEQFTGIVDSAHMQDFEQGLESVNSMEQAKEAARQALTNMQKHIDQAAIFNPPIKLDEIQLLIPDEMQKNGIPYNTKERPKELKKFFPQIKNDPEQAKFVADLMIVYSNIEQAILDMEGFRLNRDPKNISSPAMSNVKRGMENIVATHQNRGANEMIMGIYDGILNSESQKIMSQNENLMRIDWVNRLFVYGVDPMVVDVIKDTVKERTLKDKS